MAKQGQIGRGGRNTLKGILWTGAVLGATALANYYIFYQTPPLTSTLEGGELRYFPLPQGDVFYKKAGDGPPLLLIHGIGAGCSSYEFRHIWKPLTEQYTVYAIDLLGFGKSDKPDIEYTAELYIDLIERFAREVIGVGAGQEEADVIATSLSAAYAIALSRRNPDLFRRLVLICPTGIEELHKPVTQLSHIARTALKTPILGTALYNAITSKNGIGTYLAKHVYANPNDVTEEVINQYYVSAHQPGGEHVLPYFLSGFLNINIADDFKHIVDLPLLVWGNAAQETPLTQSEPFLTANPHAKLEVIEEAGLLPHEEQPEAFLAAVRPFLAEPEQTEADDIVVAVVIEEAGE